MPEVFVRLKTSYYLCGKIQLMKDLICIGHITHDRIVTPQMQTEMAGGTAFYMAHAISHLPRKIDFGLLTKVGADAQDEVRRIREAGIDVRALASRQTVSFENRYGSNANNRSQRVSAEADPFTLADVEGLRARVFHLGALLPDDFHIDVVRSLKERGAVSIDAQGFLRRVCEGRVVESEWPQRDAMLSLCDFIKLNEHEMKTISGMTDSHHVARWLASYGIREVIITLGSEGSMVLRDGVYYDIPAYPPRQLVDATGCGDTYSAGYLYFRALGATPLEAGKMAAAMCTKKLEGSGPFVSTIEEVRSIAAASNASRELSVGP